LFYFFFYFDGMYPRETATNSQSALPATNRKHPVKHRYRFTIAKDSRNRKVRGLWRRGEKLYADPSFRREVCAQDSAQS